MAHKDNGVNDTARILKINKNKVISHLKKNCEVKELNEDFVKCLPDETEKKSLNQLGISVCISADCDEQWGFVGRKKNKKWLWYILEKTTKKVIAFTFGKRDNNTFKKLIEKRPIF